MRIRRLLLVASLPLAAGAFVFQQRATVQSARLLEQVMQLVATRYVDTLGTGDLYEKAARGLVYELKDPYTTLLSPKELVQFNTTSTGRYGGIGMEIIESQGFVTVQRVFPHTPAEQAGVQEGDRIISIDTANARGWTISQASEALRGEPGSRVNVRFARPGVAELIPIRFTRAVIHIPAVPYSLMLDGRIGYIPLLQFNETATNELEAAARNLVREGARGIIVDLRDNPGGILEQSLAVSNLFLERGEDLLSVRGRATEDQMFVAEHDPVSTSLPLVVLINGRSASASEIVAGALQDHDRALVVGTTSFGKGLVQTIFPLSGGYALKMTTAKWFTPSGRSIQQDRKVLPDGSLTEPDEPDSLETNRDRRSRPQFRSDAGRIVYGGGAITPDVIVQPDTLTTPEQKLLQALAPKSQIVNATLRDYARELRASVRPNFVVRPEWRAELYRRLDRAGAKVDTATYRAGGEEIDRLLRNRVAHAAFGDSVAKLRALGDDRQLLRAADLMRQGQTQRDLFVIAQRIAAVPQAGTQAADSRQ